MKYHAGEIEVQKREGVRLMAERIGNGIRDFMMPIAMEFLQEQPFAVVSAADNDGFVWASPLIGKIEAVDESHISAQQAVDKDDPLYSVLVDEAAIGLIFIEFATRRRMRVNGQVQNRVGTNFAIQVQQAYSNCQKHIHPREHRVLTFSSERDPLTTTALTDSQVHWIEQADTLFIASLHPEGGADASHRGGEQGFVRVVDMNHIQIPDYAGNMMFNTLGNIVANPAIGLLFIDFETGGLLQVSGHASISWNETLLNNFPHAQRIIEVSLSKVLQR